MLEAIKTLLKIQGNDYDKELELWIEAGIQYIENVGVPRPTNENGEEINDEALYNVCLAMYVESMFDDRPNSFSRVSSPFQITLTQLRARNGN